MKQVELYNHNKTTYENITRIFETSNKCATVQPTGSGKSFLIFKLAQDNSDKTIVVFEPNKQIIGRVSEQMKEYGIDNIKFYTYQKLNSQHKRDEISIDNADYICLDELHRIKAKQWEQAVIAIQDKFPNAKVLGLTATPERMDGQNIIDYFGAELACNITLGDAIVNKILPCPTYISALYTFDEEIQRVFDKINESRNSDEEKNDMRAELEVARKQLENALGVPTILKKHIPDSNGKYIVFCQNVEHLNTMKSTIKDWFIQAGFDVHMYEVHTKNSNHKTEYNGFKADNSDCIKLCLCVDMFNEGVHLEGISGVILLRPTQSNIIYFQQIGRAISASDENIPIIFDLVNNGNCLGGGSLRTEIESAVESQRTGNSNIYRKYGGNEIFDVGDFYISDYVNDSLDILNRIENKCIDEFDFRLNQLREYKEKYGHCCIMANEAKEWDGLWKWTRCICECYRTKEISKQKYIALQNIGFVWTNKDDWFFNYKLERMKLYLKNGGKFPIKLRYKCSDGFPLGQYAMTFKTSIRKGTLKQEYITALEEIGFDFNNIDYDEKWLLLFREFLATGENLTTRSKFKGKDLGSQLVKYKNKYKKRLLSQHIINELLSLGINFEQNNDDKVWDSFMMNLSKYLNYNSNVTSRSKTDECHIGSKLYRCKNQYKQGIFPEERYQQLLSLGIDLAKEGSLM